MSPESLKETEDKSGYDGFLSDLWSLGVTFYCMLYKGLPFYDYNIMHLFKKIQEQE
jgi:serine/threonine protein kinase